MDEILTIVSNYGSKQALVFGKGENEDLKGYTLVFPFCPSRQCLVRDMCIFNQKN